MAVTKVVSIEVTDLTTRVIEMGFGKKDQTIYKAVIFDTPAHTVNDGVIENPDVYGKELASKLKEAGIHSKDCIFSLASSKVISREVTTADLKDEQIPDFIESQKGEYFPMDTTGFILVHRIIERNKDAKTMRMNIFGIPGRIIQTYQEIAGMAGLKVLSIDYSGNAMYQFLQQETHKDIDIYLHIGGHNTTLTILEERKLAIQRNLNFGANLLADRVIGSGYFNEDLNRRTAMKKLEEEELMFSSIGSTNRIPRGETEAAEALNNLKAALTEGMKQFINNVSRVLEYYHTKSKGAEISKIHIGGPGARIKGLKSLLENEFIGVEIVILNQLPDIKLSSAVEKADYNTTEFIAIIGAVDCSMTFVAASEKEKMQKAVMLCGIALILVIVAAVVLIFIAKSGYDNKLTERDNLKNKIQQLEDTGIEALEAQYNDAATRVTNAITFDDMTYRFSEDWNTILTGLEENVVSSMVLSSMASNNSGLTLNVVVANKESAAKLLMQLAKIPYFDRISSNTINENSQDGTLPVVSMTIVCSYKEYFDQDINGDGQINEADDKNNDGIIDVLDICGDYNVDGVQDRRDIEKWRLDQKKKAFELIANDINRDGVFDEKDDIDRNGIIDSIDRELYLIIESGIIVDYSIAPNYNLTPELMQEIIESYNAPEEGAEEVAK